jgi:hypothetical protein
MQATLVCRSRYNSPRFVVNIDDEEFQSTFAIGAMVRVNGTDFRVSEVDATGERPLVVLLRAVELH